MFDINRYGKWFYIAFGLLILVGITGYFSGGKNGSLIFSYSITTIFVIMLIVFVLLKLPELRYGREKVWQMRKEEREREYRQIKEESDLWDSLNKEQRKDLCNRLELSTKYWKWSLIDVPTKDRKTLMYVLNVEFAKDVKGKWDSSLGQPTYYDILGVDKNASETEINTAFRKRILAWHPDKKKDIADADEYTKILYEAKEVLLDKDRRRKYDATIT
ncbi:MAG: J domain-containing protein [Patescibacteria group bacterium]|nr:J domain-containing protein [Patescibacteria group bacterium]